MLFPETWRPIKDSAPWRKEFFIYLPSLQLAPVIPGREGAHDPGRETRGRFAMQNANCGARRFDSFKLGLIEPAADNSQAELMLKDAVDRRIRDRINPLQCLVRIVRHSRGIAQKQDKKNVGIRRQRSGLLLHLTPSQVIETLEIHDARKILLLVA